MPLLRVANVHFEATGANRLEYLNSQVQFKTGGGNYTISVGGTESVNVGAGGVVVSGINVVPQIALAFNKANNALPNATGTFSGDLTYAGNVYVGASYNVGIGTASPTAALDVRGSYSDAGANNKDSSSLLLNYDALVGHFVEAIKELKEKIDVLEKKCDKYTKISKKRAD